MTRIDYFRMRAVHDAVCETFYSESFLLPRWDKRFNKRLSRTRSAFVWICIAEYGHEYERAVSEFIDRSLGAVRRIWGVVCPNSTSNADYRRLLKIAQTESRRLVAEILEADAERGAA